MEDQRKFGLDDDALDSVAGGGTEFDGGSAQADTVPAMLPILLHPHARTEEDDGTNEGPGFVGRTVF